MTRLWDKGLPLDERVLRYTAGEDHRLDARLVEYDVRGSSAHARMLAAQGLISDEDSEAICLGLKALHEAFERGEWQIELADEDVTHGAREQTHRQRRRTGRQAAPWPLTKRSGAYRAQALSERRRRRSRLAHCPACETP